MAGLTTCTVTNKSNEPEQLVICTKWLDETIKFLIIKSDKSLFMDEVPLEHFDKYAKNFNKSPEVYLVETQNILSGNNQDIDFNLKDNAFYWKRKNWLLGKLILTPVTELDCLIDFTLIVIDHFSKQNKEVLELKKDNKHVKTLYSDLNYKVNEIIVLKEQSEVAMYKRFILLLNSKKAKIRELKSKLEHLERKNDSIYDITTDESENEVHNKDLFSNINKTKKSLNKRSHEDSNSELPEKTMKIKVFRNIDKGNKDKICEKHETKICEVKEKNLTNTQKMETIAENKINDGKKKIEVEEIEKEEKLVNSPKSKENKDEIVKKTIEKQKLSQDIKKTKRIQNKIADKHEEMVVDVPEEQINIDNNTKSDLAEEKVLKEIEISKVADKPIASTSKSINSLSTTIGEDEETPDFLSDESECEMELKLEDEKDEKSAIAEADSEEMAFN